MISCYPPGAMNYRAVFYDWGGINTMLLHLANQVTEPAYVQFMLLGSTLGKYTLFPIYLALILITAFWCVNREKPNAGYRKHWEQTVAVFLLSYGLSWTWVSPLKHALQMPRPFVTLPEGSVHILAEIKQMEAPLASFPSGHFTFAVTLVASLWPLLTMPWKAAGVFFVLWVGISRVALGAHFPADILGTLPLALLAVCFMRFLAEQIYPVKPTL